MLLCSCVSPDLWGNWGSGGTWGPGAATRFILPRVAAAEPSLGMFPTLQCFQCFQRFQCSNLAAGGVSRSVAKMWPSVSLLCVLVAFTSARSVPYFPPLSDDLVNHINKLNTTWKVSTGLMIWGFFLDALLTVSTWDLVAELWECHHGGDINPALVPADFSGEVMLSGVPAVTGDCGAPPWSRAGWICGVGAM